MARRLLAAVIFVIITVVTERCRPVRGVREKKAAAHGVYSTPGGHRERNYHFVPPVVQCSGPTVQVYNIVSREIIIRLGNYARPSSRRAHTFIILSGARTNRSGTEGVNDFSGFVAVFYCAICVIIIIFVVIVVNLRSFVQGSRPNDTVSRVSVRTDRSLTVSQ